MRFVQYWNENNSYLFNPFVHSWLWSEFIKMASVTRFIRGHISLYNEADQFWSHCITITSGIFLFTTES